MDIRVGRQDEEFAPWSVLSDIAITMVLFLVIFIVMQFLQTYRQRAIENALKRKQAAVLEAVLAVSDNTVSVVTISPERQLLTFSDATLFETCRANLKASGDSLLVRVGLVLGRSQADFETVSVEGHTDSLPISERGQCDFRSNWELSSARATTVVSLWSGNSIIENTKLSAVGRSEYHPIDPIRLEANRRIEVVLVYDRKRVDELIRGGRQ